MGEECKKKAKLSERVKTHDLFYGRIAKYAAQQAFSECDDSEKEEKALKMVSRYDARCTRCGGFYAIIVGSTTSIVSAIFNKKLILFIGILLLIVYSIIYLVSNMEKDIWQEILDEYRTALNKKKDNTIKDLEESNVKLLEKMKYLESDRNRLSEFMTVAALLESKRREGDINYVSQTLVSRMLTVLGLGEYSVALYHLSEDRYILYEYETTQNTHKKPSSYKKVIERSDSKYKNHFVYNCIFERSPEKHIFHNKAEVKRGLVGDVDDIRQYANIFIKFDHNHGILLELIAYKETCFGSEGDYCDEYLTSFFDTYVPLLELFLDDNVIITGVYSKTLVQEDEVV